MTNDIEKEHLLTEKQLLAKKQLLLQMEKDIKSLEYNINHYNISNLRVTIMRNLKLNYLALRLITPYAITAGLMTGIFTSFGHTPFYNGDKRYHYLHRMTEFDNLGNVRYEMQYNEFDNNYNRLYYCTNWESEDDGFYSRDVLTFLIRDYIYEDVLDLFEKNREDISIKEILGEPISSVKELKNNLTKEELEEKKYIKEVVYNEDKNEFIVCKETVEENILSTIIWRH